MCVSMHVGLFMCIYMYINVSDYLVENCFQLTKATGEVHKCLCVRVCMCIFTCTCYGNILCMTTVARNRT
jgi:hypothetical protein